MLIEPKSKLSPLTVVIRSCVSSADKDLLPPRENDAAPLDSPSVPDATQVNDEACFSRSSTMPCTTLADALEAAQGETA